MTAGLLAVLCLVCQSPRLKVTQQQRWQQRSQQRSHRQRCGSSVSLAAASSLASALLLPIQFGAELRDVLIVVNRRRRRRRCRSRCRCDLPMLQE